MFPMLNVVRYSPGWKKLLCFVEFKWISIFVLPDWKWRKLFSWEFRNILCLRLWTCGPSLSWDFKEIVLGRFLGNWGDRCLNMMQFCLRPFLRLPALSGCWRNTVKCNEPSVTTLLPKGAPSSCGGTGTEHGCPRACSVSACQLTSVRS